MNDTQESLDLTILETLDFQPECQGDAHAIGEVGHRPDEPAAFLQITPCGEERFKCAGNVRFLLSWGHLAPCRCGATHHARELTFIPL